MNPKKIKLYFWQIHYMTHPLLCLQTLVPPLPCPIGPFSTSLRRLAENVDSSSENLTFYTVCSYLGHNQCNLSPASYTLLWWRCWGSCHTLKPYVLHPRFEPSWRWRGGLRCYKSHTGESCYPSMILKSSGSPTQ